MTEQFLRNENTTMADYFNDDFRDFPKALNNHGVEYILVGGMAVILHGYVRTTGDMGVLVNKTKENYIRLRKALYEFGMPVFDMTEQAFLGEEFNVWVFGRSPVKIEVMTAVKGLDFQSSYSIAKYYDEGGISIRFLHITSLIESKKAAGRYKD